VPSTASDAPEKPTSPAIDKKDGNEIPASEPGARARAEALFSKSKPSATQSSPDEGIANEQPSLERVVTPPDNKAIEQDKPISQVVSQRCDNLDKQINRVKALYASADNSQHRLENLRHNSESKEKHVEKLTELQTIISSDDVEAKRQWLSKYDDLKQQPSVIPNLSEPEIALLLDKHKQLVEVFIQNATTAGELYEKRNNIEGWTSEIKTSLTDKEHEDLSSNDVGKVFQVLQELDDKLNLKINFEQVIEQSGQDKLLLGHIRLKLENYLGTLKRYANEKQSHQFSNLFGTIPNYMTEPKLLELVDKQAKLVKEVLTLLPKSDVIYQSASPSAEPAPAVAETGTAADSSAPANEAIPSEAKERYENLFNQLDMEKKAKKAYIGDLLKALEYARDNNDSLNNKQQKQADMLRRIVGERLESRNKVLKEINTAHTKGDTQTKTQLETHLSKHFS
jgi:hypothetical protein